MSNQIDAIMMFVERGWHPYTGQVDVAVYQQLECPAPLFAKWFYEGQEAQEALCVGCERQCRVDCTEGFKPAPKRFQALYKGYYYSLTPLEMVKRHTLLRVEQAAYCLNIAERTVRDMIENGELVATKRKPVRVRSEEVLRLMNDFDE